MRLRQWRNADVENKGIHHLTKKTPQFKAHNASEIQIERICIKLDFVYLNKFLRSGITATMAYVSFPAVKDA